MLMQSLQEEDDNSGGTADIVAKIQSQSSLISTSQLGDNDASLPPSITSSTGNSFAEDLESDSIRPIVPQNFLLAPQTSTPWITPPGSPPSMSASVSPTRTSKSASPRRHSISFSIPRGIYDDRSSVFSSISTSDPGTGSQTGRTGGWEGVLSPSQETLRKADEIFGAENNDLYTF